LNDAKAKILKNLTIAIPTFNRNIQLQSNLACILRQNISNVSILVIDNCSDIPVVDTLAKELEIFGDTLKVVRNRANVGLAGNFIKCIELCETKWMWLLSVRLLILISQHMSGHLLGNNHLRQAAWMSWLLSWIPFRIFCFIQAVFITFLFCQNHYDLA